jgi:hypothetical protein
VGWRKQDKTSDVATLVPAEQLVSAEGWGELRPDQALRGHTGVTGPVAVAPGKSVALDLAYDLSHIVDPAKAERFSLRWSVDIPGSSYTGETLFRQLAPVRYAGLYPYGSRAWSGWWFDPFFARPAGSHFFNPFFGCDPRFGFCGRPLVVRFRDRDDGRGLRDRDDLRFRDRDDHPTGGGHTDVMPAHGGGS